MRLADVFGLDPSPIQKDRLRDRRGLTVRPLDMSLSNARIGAVLGRSFGQVTEQLRELAASVRPVETAGNQS